MNTNGYHESAGPNEVGAFYDWGTPETSPADDSESRTTSPPKVLIVGGAGAGKLTLRGTERAFREEGLEAYTFTPTAKPAPKDPSVPNQRRYQQSKAEQVAGFIDSLVGDGEKITLYAHSLGGPVALRAALARPDKVDRVVLSNSEGLSRHSVEKRLPFIRLAGRFLLELNARKNLTLTKQGVTQTATGLADIVRHPLSFVGSAKDGARTYAVPMVRHLKALGIPVDVITSNMDLVYSADEVVKTAEREAAIIETSDGAAVKEMPFNSISSYYAAKPKLGSLKMPRWLKTEPIPDIKIKDEDDEATRLRKEATADTRKMAMRGVRARNHRLAGKYAGHDQPIIYPRYAAKVVRQIIRPQEVVGEYERFSLSQRLAAAAQGALLNAKDKWSELSRGSRVAAVGLGALAVVGTVYLARRGFDMPSFELDGSITDQPERAPGAGLPVGPDGAEPPSPTDISGSLNLPDGYIREAATGYEITAMHGSQTDSIWAAAEHALTDKLGADPSIKQIDALKDLIGEHHLDIGEKLTISNDQIEEAIRIASAQ